MNIIVVGAGEIGRHLAGVLSGEGHRVSLIEREEGLAGEVEGSLDVKVVRGDGGRVGALVEANVEECELFLAVTSSNAVNW